MSIYDEMQSLTKELLSDPEFNQGGTGKIEFVRIIPGNGPIDEPGEPTIEKIPLDAAARGATFKYVSTGLAAASDLQVVAAVVDGLEPTDKDFIEVNGERCKIMQILPRPAAGTTVAWLFIVQRGEKSNRTVS